MKAQFIVALSICFLFTKTTNADPRAVYRWEDPKTGSIHYSSKAPSKDARPAELPKITRGEVKVNKTKNVTCDSHGGVNCQAGTDGDGSAICSDGFKDVTTRFRFACSSPKLEITDISELTEAGNFTIFVRNSKSVAAKKPVVSYQPDFGDKVTLTGPASVEPFGIAEFTFNYEELALKGKTLKLSKKPNAGQIDVSCENCN